MSNENVQCNDIIEEMNEGTIQCKTSWNEPLDRKSD